LTTNESYISEGERIIEVCNKEGPDMVMKPYAMDMMVAYSLVADTPNYRGYIRMVLGIIQATAPPGHQDIITVDKFLETPKKPAGGAWGNRPPKKV
jgi:hypothetical protein